MSFNEKDISDIYNYFGLKEDGDYKSLVFDGNLDALNISDLTDTLYKFENQENVTFVVSIDNYQDLNFEYYVLSEKSVEELFGFNGIDEKMNLVDSTFEASTESSVYNLPLINKNVKLKIQPMNSFDDKYSISIDIFASDEVVERFAGLIVEEYSVFLPEIVDFETNTYNYDLAIKESMIIISSMTIILLMIVLLSYLSSALKEISILKLQGYSNIRIFSYLLGKDMIIIIMSTVLINIALFIVNVGILTPSSTQMIQYLLVYNTVLISMVIVASLLFVLGLRFLSINSLIKGRNLNSSFATATYCIKVLSILLLLPIVSSKMLPLVNDSKLLFKLITSKEQYEHNYTVKGFTNEYRENEINFIERSDETNNYAYIKQIKLLEELQKAGAEFFVSDSYVVENRDKSKSDLELNITTVNENFIREHLRTSKILNSILNELEENDAVMLLKQEEIENYVFEPNYILDEKTKFAIIDQTSDYSLFTYNKPKPDILLVYSNDAPRNSKSVFNGIYLNDDKTEQIDRIIKDNQFDGQFAYNYLIDEYNSDFKNLVWNISLNLMTLIPAICILILMSYSFYESYHKSNSQLILIKQIHGYSIINVYKDYVLEAFLPFMLVFFFEPEKKMVSLMILLICELFVFAFVLAKQYKIPLSISIKRREI